MTIPVVRALLQRGLLLSLSFAALLPSATSAEPTTGATGHGFTCTLAKPGLTSAVIRDRDGRIVQTLWAMKGKEAGPLAVTWDGCDDAGSRVPAGEYTWQVVLNRSTYSSTGAIGNTGLPPVTSSHVPFLIEGVAVDAQGAAYTVHDWDEAFKNIIKWSPQTGRSEFQMGSVIGDHLLKGIAVEPDGSYAYVTGYGEFTNRAKTRLRLWKINLARGQDAEREDFTKAGECIKIYEGGAELPADAPPADHELMLNPLLSVALQGGTIFVTDALKGRVLMYDKVSGEAKGEFPVPLACGLAVGKDGRIWVGHEHAKVSVFDASGKRLATPISDLSDVRALALSGNKLYVADRSGNQVRVYEIAGTTLKLVDRFGLPQRPGDTAANRLKHIQGMAVDAQGNVVISDHQGDGARLQRLAPGWKQTWRQLSMEFSSQATFGVSNPDLLFTAEKNAYKIDRKTGGWEFLGCGRTDLANDVFFGNRGLHHSGPPRVARFGEHDFYFYPRGDGLAVYRIEPSSEPQRGPTLVLVSALSGSLPGPDGADHSRDNDASNRYLWSWHDEQGDHQPQREEIDIAAGPDPAKPADPKWNWVRGPINIDQRGCLWIACPAAGKPAAAGGNEQWGNDRSTLYALPMRGLNKLGNPIYDWRDAVRVAAPELGRQALGLDDKTEFFWKLVNASSDDGMIYAMAHTKLAGTAQEGGLHMGGNLLIGLRGSQDGKPEPLTQPAWVTRLPTMAVGLSVIPGGNGGVLIGGDPWRNGVRHYTKDGLLIGAFQSDPRYGASPLDQPTGLLDAYHALDCNRDPRDGVLDVFSEDNFNQRILWYRVDDRDITSSTGKLVVK